MSLRSSRRIRLVAPVAVAGVIGLGAWLPTVTASASTPDLPTLTPAQLIAKVASAHVPGLSGTVRWSANLGLPDISSLTSGQGSSGSSFTPTSLLSGTHTIKVWDAGADQQRLAVPTSMAEVDFVRNGQQAWYYDSSTDAVTHLVAAPGSSTPEASHPDAHANDPALTPDQLAQKLLAHLTPSTAVSVTSPVYVANGHSAYQLVLSPAAGTAGAGASTVSQITMAVDATTGVPLQISVDAKGQSAPALQVGFDSVSFTTPSASEFTAPTGSSETTKTVGGQGGAHHSHDGTWGPAPTITGSDWGQIATFAADHGPATGSAQHQLNQLSTPVTGSFGTARLVQTNLLNALILPDGRVLAGFVTPSALESAAGH